MWPRLKVCLPASRSGLKVDIFLPQDLDHKCAFHFWIIVNSRYNQIDTQDQLSQEATISCMIRWWEESVTVLIQVTFIALTCMAVCWGGKMLTPLSIQRCDHMWSSDQLLRIFIPLLWVQFSVSPGTTSDTLNFILKLPCKVAYFLTAFSYKPTSDWLSLLPTSVLHPPSLTPCLYPAIPGTQVSTFTK